MYQPRQLRRKPPELFETPGESTEGLTPQQKLEHRHAILMECRDDEQERQAEERFQMAIDEDFQDHLQWDLESASTLISRGQTPLVFNEGRLSVEWICGTEKRTRIDYKILPREEADEQGAEIKTKVVKYTDDVNLAPFHRSRAFRKAVTCGLGWLEESINIEPGEEIIYSGSVDWREVLRDSRSRDVDYNKDGRYLFRDKRVDLDYAIALLPHAKEALTRNSQRRTSDESDEPWYLGERLTSAHDLEYNNALPTNSRDRGAYIGTSYMDTGRRRSVTLIEAWYKVPETVEIFQGGPFRSQEFDAKNPEHVEHRASAGFSGVYKTVAWRMRVMICTEDAPLGDWPSPFKHNKFTLVPVYGYRRARDGMCYGVWRGMRDPQTDLNKRMSKALWAASSNRVVAKKGAVEDVDEARDEAARPDMWLEVEKNIEDIRFEKPAADVQFSLELANQDRQMIRTVGGVTSENLGHDTNATSGKAILAKQDQGSMTTADLFDNYRLAIQLAGQLRLSHIEQYKTERQVIRIVGKNKPIEWVTINEFDEETGQYLNDITNQQADFIVSEQDYRASMQQAAAETMADILAKVAPFAPQAVINVLDLWVDLMDIPNKEEFVSRIRKFNGQTDPAKKPTPEEQQAIQANTQKQAQQEAMQMEQAMQMLNELKAKISKMEADAAEVRTRTLYQAIQAGQIVAQVPGVAPVADEIARGAGFKDQGGQDPNIPAPQVQQLAAPVQQAPELLQSDGAMQGIETPQADGLQ
jgi:hypothetical protein